MYAKITKDLLSPIGGEYEEDNVEGRVVFNGDYEGELVSVRLLDDDRIPYYEVLADEAALEPLLNWGGPYAGITILQTRENGAWQDCMS